jgi:hypothetical protein
MSCENDHNEHSIIYYGKLIIKENKIIDRMKEIRKEIDIFNNDIKEKINKLNKIIENIEEYYKIIDNIIKNSINNKRRNYQLLISINNIINNNNMINNIKKINENNNKYDDIIDIYNKIYNNKNNENIDNDNNINNENIKNNNNNIIINYDYNNNNDKNDIEKYIIRRNKKNEKKIENKEYNNYNYYQNVKEDEKLEQHTEKYYDNQGNLIRGKNIIIKRNNKDNGDNSIKEVIQEEFKSNPNNLFKRYVPIKDKEGQFIKEKKENDFNKNNEESKNIKDFNTVIMNANRFGSGSGEKKIKKSEEEENKNRNFTFGKKIDNDFRIEIEDKEEKEANEQQISVNSEFEDENEK